MCVRVGGVCVCVCVWVGGVCVCVRECVGGVENKKIKIVRSD